MLHSYGIYHGDLVLLNIFVTTKGRKPQFKIGDFTKAVVNVSSMKQPFIPLNFFSLCGFFLVPDETDRDQLRNSDFSNLGRILFQLIHFMKDKRIPLGDISQPLCAMIDAGTITTEEVRYSVVSLLSIC